MEILRTRRELREFSARQKAEGRSVGLVPTMGALHAGHLSLMQRAVKENNAAIASVFVNPTQFNDKGDLKAYPRTEEADFALLRSAGVSAVFAPTPDEVYPKDEAEPSGHVFDLGAVADVMEGPRRPGHFQGVAQIVSRLMRWADPDRAYFGEKDFQQIAVIRRMVQTEGLDSVQIVACPIVREADGLALSSRNVRLTPEQRQIAPGIHRILAESVALSHDRSVSEVHDFVVDAVNALPQCRVEYFEIVDAVTMQPVSSWDVKDGVQGCITVYCGDVRLIDNINYRLMINV